MIRILSLVCYSPDSCEPFSVLLTYIHTYVFCVGVTCVHLYANDLYNSERVPSFLV